MTGIYILLHLCCGDVCRDGKAIEVCRARRVVYRGSIVCVWWLFGNAVAWTLVLKKDAARSIANEKVKDARTFLICSEGFQTESRINSYCCTRKVE